MNPGFWAGKRILVTGHTGFKGAWLCLLLKHLQAEVCGFALAPSGPRSMFEEVDASKGILSCLGDVRDIDALTKSVRNFRPDIILHLAAQSLVIDSYKDPVGTYSTNIMGTVHVLEVARQLNLAAVLIVTSDKSYQNREWIWGYRENESLGGHDPYSSSKGCAELVTSAYRSSFFQNMNDCSVASARAGNVIGGGDWSTNRLVPDIISGLSKRLVPIIRNPTALRPWQHVLDCLSGYLAVSEKLLERSGEFCEAWNFGPDESDTQSVGWIADRICEHWGRGAAWQRSSEEPAYHEAGYLKLDSAKARVRLGWKPRLSLDRALKMTVDWYSAGNTSADMKNFTRGQIEQYRALWQ